MKSNVRRAPSANSRGVDVEMMGQDAGQADNDLGPYFGGSRNSTTKPHPAELVDQASRGLFPLGFMICNVAYWLYYLYFTDQDLASIQEMQDVHA